MQEWLLPMGVVLWGYTVLGLTGFGSALVIVPLLAWNWPLPEVVALTLLMDVPASAFHSGLMLALGARRGTICTSDDVTFGGGTKADGAMSNRIRSRGVPAATVANRRVGRANAAPAARVPFRMSRRFIDP